MQDKYIIDSVSQTRTLLPSSPTLVVYSIFTMLAITGNSAVVYSIAADITPSPAVAPNGIALYLGGGRCVKGGEASVNKD